jgi:hypothetical protein
MNKYMLYLLRAIIPIIGVAMIPVSAQADAKNMKILDKAYMNALNKDFKQAIDKTLPLLDSLALSKIEEIVLAHQILTLSYCETGNKEKTKEHFTALKALAPNEDFRAFSVSSECQKNAERISNSRQNKEEKITNDAGV